MSSSYPGDPSSPDEQPQGSPQQGQPSPAYGGPAYGGPSYGGPAAAAPAPSLYDAPSGSPSWGVAPPPYAQRYAAPGPDHPKAMVALVLGIVGLLGGFTCGLPLLVSPFAWGLGRRALKDIRRSQGHVGGEGQAKAGMVLGIIGTVLLILLVLLVVGFVLLALAATDTTTPGSSV